MKSSGLLKWLMIPVLLVAVYLVVRLLSSAADAPMPSSTPTSDTQLTPKEMQSLGIAGDTPRDTVATLVAQVKQLRKEVQAVTEENKQQKTQNAQLRQREGAVDQRIQGALAAERDRWRQDEQHRDEQEQRTRALLEDMKRQVQGMSDHSRSTDLPVGLGLEAGDAERFQKTPRWIEPENAIKSGAGKAPSLRTAPADIEPREEAGASQFESRAQEDAPVVRIGHRLASAGTVKPMYTVPPASTLIGSTAMTAMIGRIPIDGALSDAYPFKVIIGSDNLVANGIDLPNLHGAVASGTASGDWTLSCVRGRIRTLTFVFNDGTIRTASTAENGDASENSSNELGWISDPHGIPCISGRRVSNAQQYLGTQALITAAGAGAASLIDPGAGNVSYFSGSNGALGTVGITGNEAMGRILSSGVQEMSQWVNKLYGQAFAAVYVPPLAEVAVHIERELQIDYETAGRRVTHAQGGSHAAELD